MKQLLQDYKKGKVEIGVLSMPNYSTVWGKKGLDKKTNNKIYDIAGKESLSFNNIIKLCKSRFNIKKPLIHIPIFLCLILFRIFPITSLESIKGINQDTSANISLLVKDLKITPRSFKEGLKDVHI